MLDTYYLTTLDLWILEKVDIPLVVYSATSFPENENTLIVAIQQMVHSFVKVPGVKVNITKYRLLINGTNPMINLDEVSMSVSVDIEQQRAPEDILVIL